MKTSKKEIDELVSEKIFNIPKGTTQYVNDDLNQGFYFGAKPYSTNLDLAYKILEHFHTTGRVWVIEQADTSEKPTVHIVSKADSATNEFIHFIEDMERISYSADTLAMAICLVGLRAAGVEIT